MQLALFDIQNSGPTVRVVHQGEMICRPCAGEGVVLCESCGEEGFIECHTCGGSRACPTCDGVPRGDCADCRGTGSEALARGALLSKIWQRVPKPIQQAVFAVHLECKVGYPIVDPSGIVAVAGKFKAATIRRLRKLNFANVVEDEFVWMMPVEEVPWLDPDEKKALRRHVENELLDDPDIRPARSLLGGAA